MTSAIEPLLRVRYGEFINPLPSQDTIAAFAPFVPKESRDGRSFNFPVRLGLPHGVTFDDTRTAFTLGAVVPAATKEATLSGSAIVVRDNVSYDDVFATKNGIANGGGAGGAYFEAFDYCTTGLMQSGELYREAQLMYGPGPSSTAAANIGIVEANETSADLDPGCVLSITRETWAPGLWPNLIGAVVDIYETDGATLRAAGCTVLAMDESQNRITLFKASSTVTPAATDILLLRSNIDVSCYGLQPIMANTGSLFGIDAATYPQWKAASYSASDLPLDRRGVLNLCSRQVARGQKGGAQLLVSGPCVADLIDEAAELHRDNDAPDTVVHGATGVTYKTPIGPVEVKIHPYMKQGIGMLLPKGKVKRVGSTDLSFSNGKNEWFYQELADSAGSQLRIFTNQAIVIESPWHSVLLTDIQSTGDTLPS